MVDKQNMANGADTSKEFLSMPKASANEEKKQLGQQDMANGADTYKEFQTVPEASAHEQKKS